MLDSPLLVPSIAWSVVDLVIVESPLPDKDKTSPRVLACDVTIFGVVLYVVVPSVVVMTLTGLLCVAVVVILVEPDVMPFVNPWSLVLLSVYPLSVTDVWIAEWRGVSLIAVVMSNTA